MTVPKAKTTVVVLGSNCFSGSYMVDELLTNPNYFVVGISRSAEKSELYLPYKARNLTNFEFYQVDMLREPDKLINLLDLLRPSIIINFAALSEVAVSNFRPLDYFQTNCVSLVDLCNQLRNREYIKRFIQISTAELYGDCPEPVLETSCTNPTTPYAVPKHAADQFLMSIRKVFDFPVILVRSTNVYGKHQQLFKVMPRTVIYLKSGRTLELHGNGKMVRCFLHIRDLVQGVAAVTAKGKLGDIYHFAVPDRPTVADIIESICKKMGYNFKDITVPVEIRPGADARYLLDYTKSTKELGWKPKITLDQGLQEVIDWVQDKWEDIQKEPHIYIHKP